MPDVDSKIWMEKAWLPGLFPLSELKKVMLSELKVNSRNLTSYILVKTTSLRTPDPMVEDEEGNTAKACIVFYDGHQLLSEALGIAEVFILKLPLCLVEDGSQVMMIHHLSDIKVLTSDNPLFPDSWKMAGEGFSATQLKDLGNQHMKHKQYYDAIACYNHGLLATSSSDLIATLRLNRCQARIAIQCYETALDDAQFILTSCPKGVQSPRHEKVLFRCTRALYELQRYEQCLLELQKLCKFYPQNERAAGELARCQQRVLEATSGCYNFDAWIAHATDRVKNKQSPLIDATTFCSPVEVRKSDTHGHGLFTKKAVEAGDLLLCEKAFLCAFSFADAHSSTSQNQELKRRLSTISPAESPDNPTLDENGFSQSDAINMELLAGTFRFLSRGFCFPLPCIVEKNKFFQGSAQTLFTLHGGDRRQNEDPQLPIEDILQRSLSLQANESSARPIEDVLESLMSSLSKHPYLPASTVGMWLLACRANHDCLPNVSRSFIGDMLILRASRPLPAGSEIFDSYTSGTEPYNTRRANLRRYGFQCKCAMCEMDEMVSEGAHAQREGLFNGLIIDMMSPKATTGDEIDLWIKKIGMTYACDSRDSVAPRLDMSTSLFWAVKGGVDSGIPQMVFQYGMLLLRVMGIDFEVKDDDEIEISQWGIQTAFVVETLWYLREATGKGGPGWNTIDAVLRKTYLMEVGEDSSFERFYGDPK